MSATIKRCASIVAILGIILLSGCESASKETQEDKEAKIELARNTIEDYFLSVLRGDGDELSKETTDAMNSLSDEDKGALQEIEGGSRKKVDLGVTQRISRTFEKIDPAAKLYSTQGVTREESAIVSLASSTVASSVRQTLGNDTSRIQITGSPASSMLNHGIIARADSFQFSTKSVRITLHDKNVTRDVAKMLPAKIRMVYNGEEWLVDPRPLVDFYLGKERSYDQCS